ncbi:DoxX family protein [Nocardia sp. alder85J]|uniref:DoxX family protein n=1 Tax=Nocardia sp. alder85J TaxID=2862949 RepID=UPI001CD3E2FA|nr:DoxX family protein [Nocardia sp. alder85J]MCX4093946.1 DoxX family protein [Nocardia sp. alder85J]
MTDKSNASTEKIPHTQSGTATANGHAARSPFDAPTGQLPVLSANGTPLARTEDELGLDPEVPTVGEIGSPAMTTSYSFASIPPAPTPPAETVRMRRSRPEYRRGTTDFGLFALRLLVGLSFLYHGLQKLTGWFDGPGMDGIRRAMEHGGWKHVDIAASLLSGAEVGGGALIVLGLATPLAAGAVVATVTDAWLWKQSMAHGLEYKQVEIESLLAAAAAVLIFTGPGRLSFDRGRGWATRPSWGSFVCLLLGLAAALGSWFYLHGGNPFH